MKVYSLEGRLFAAISCTCVSITITSISIISISVVVVSCSVVVIGGWLLLGCGVCLGRLLASSWLLSFGGLLLGLGLCLSFSHGGIWLATCCGSLGLGDGLLHHGLIVIHGIFK